MPHFVSRRAVLAATAGTMVLPSMVAAQPEEYPARPIRIIVPAAPGSASEVIARTLADHLVRTLRQPILVEPVPGAAGIIGTDRVAKSPADGYTLLMGFNQLVTMNPHLYDRLPYDAQKDLAPIGMIQRGGFLLLVNKELPVDSVPGLIAMARQQPGKLAYASTGNGSAPHLGMELFKRMTGTDMLHVPYKAGSAALTDLISGQVQVKIEPKVSGMAAWRNGKVKLIGVTSAARFASIPDIPAVGEAVPGFEVAGWNALWSTGGTPPAIINRLNKELNDALATPAIREKLIGMGVDVEGSTPQAVLDLTRRESGLWGTLVRQSGIKPD